MPIVAAGGISTPERAAQVRAAGADAVQIGTALLLTPEAGTGLAYRRALADPAYAAHGGDPRLLGPTRPRPRDRLHAPARRPRPRPPIPEVHHVTVPLRRASARAERPDLLALWAGTGWRSARPVPGATVVAELAH